MRTVQLLIKGKVQGVFYRASAKHEADKLSLNGWVKNTVEGHVEALVSGSEKAVAYFINWCWQGPPMAHVTAVTVTEVTATPFEGFTISR